MPVFKAQRPRSITDAVRLFASTKDEPDALDYLQVDRAEADVRHRQALAEKVRREVEEAAASDRMRRDPRAQDEYASVTTGTPMEMVRQFRQHLAGEVVPLQGPNPDGTALEPTVMPMPNFTPQQSEGVRSALGSVMANVLATGKTNADQMTQAGGNLQKQDVVRRIQTAPTIPEANQLAQSINVRSREPFRETPSGILDEETSAIEPTDRSLALVETMKALANQRDTRANLNDARADAVVNPPPKPAPAPRPAAPPRETDAQRREREARAERIERQNLQERERNVRAKFRDEPRAKKEGWKLGAYDETKKAWRVLDKAGNVIDYYR